ncbi:unnamed protein product [Ectocarpus sp. 8 AP-2014]
MGRVLWGGIDVIPRTEPAAVRNNSERFPVCWAPSLPTNHQTLLREPLSLKTEKPGKGEERKHGERQ